MVNIDSTWQNTRFNTQMPIKKQDSVSALQMKVRRYLCRVYTEDSGSQAGCLFRSDNIIFSNVVPL